MAIIDEILSNLPEDGETFRQQHPHHFLVRRPVTMFHADEDKSAENIEYRTVTVRPDDDGIPPWQWWIAPLIKRAGNPFPGHLSVGRATNCDVVMRFRYVSKLHARIHLKDGDPAAVEDLGSSNGTGINGKKLPKGKVAEIHPGDKLSFGALVVVLMKPQGFYSLLRHRGSSQNPPQSGAR